MLTQVFEIGYNSPLKGTIELRSSIYWDGGPRRLVVAYEVSVKYPFHFQGSRSLLLVFDP